MLVQCLREYISRSLCREMTVGACAAFVRCDFQHKSHAVVAVEDLSLFWTVDRRKLLTVMLRCRHAIRVAPSTLYTALYSVP